MGGASAAGREAGRRQGGHREVCVAKAERQQLREAVQQQRQQRPHRRVPGVHAAMHRVCREHRRYAYLPRVPQAQAAPGAAARQQCCAAGRLRSRARATLHVLASRARCKPSLGRAAPASQPRRPGAGCSPGRQRRLPAAGPHLAASCHLAQGTELARTRSSTLAPRMRLLSRLRFSSITSSSRRLVVAIAVASTAAPAGISAHRGRYAKRNST